MKLLVLRFIFLYIAIPGGQVSGTEHKERNNVHEVYNNHQEAKNIMISKASLAEAVKHLQEMREAQAIKTADIGEDIEKSKLKGPEHIKHRKVKQEPQNHRATDGEFPSPSKTASPLKSDTLSHTVMEASGTEDLPSESDQRKAYSVLPTGDSVPDTTVNVTSNQVSKDKLDDSSETDGERENEDDEEENNALVNLDNNSQKNPAASSILVMADDRGDEQRKLNILENTEPKSGPNENKPTKDAFKDIGSIKHRKKHPTEEKAKSEVQFNMPPKSSNNPKINAVDISEANENTKPTDITEVVTINAAEDDTVNAPEDDAVNVPKDDTVNTLEDDTINAPEDDTDITHTNEEVPDEQKEIHVSSAETISNSAQHDNSVNTAKEKSTIVSSDQNEDKNSVHHLTKSRNKEVMQNTKSTKHSTAHLTNRTNTKQDESNSLHIPNTEQQRELNTLNDELVNSEGNKKSTVSKNIVNPVNQHQSQGGGRKKPFVKESKQKNEEIHSSQMVKEVKQHTQSGSGHNKAKPYHPVINKFNEKYFNGQHLKTSEKNLQDDKIKNENKLSHTAKDIHSDSKPIPEAAELVDNKDINLKNTMESKATEGENIAVEKLPYNSVKETSGKRKSGGSSAVIAISLTIIVTTILLTIVGIQFRQISLDRRRYIGHTLLPTDDDDMSLFNRQTYHDETLGYASWNNIT